jgi:hypothetical protein
MNRLFIILVCILIIATGTAFAAFETTLAQQNTQTKVYQPLEPLSDAQRKIDLNDPQPYITNLFSIFVSIVSILAVIRLMLCGVTYITSEAVGSKEEAKKCIWTILGGLFLILLSYLILTTINKDLVKLSFFTEVKTQVTTELAEQKIIEQAKEERNALITREQRIEQLKSLLTAIIQSRIPGLHPVGEVGAGGNLLVVEIFDPNSNDYIKSGDRFNVPRLESLTTTRFFTKEEYDDIRNTLVDLCKKYETNADLQLTTTFARRSELCELK